MAQKSEEEIWQAVVEETRRAFPDVEIETESVTSDAEEERIKRLQRHAAETEIDARHPARYGNGSPRP